MAFIDFNDFNDSKNSSSGWSRKTRFSSSYSSRIISDSNYSSSSYSNRSIITNKRMSSFNNMWGDVMERAIKERYSNKLFTYDLVSDPGFSAATIIDTKPKGLTFNEYKKKEISKELSFGGDYENYLRELLNKNYSYTQIHRIMERDDEHYSWRKDRLDDYIHDYYINEKKNVLVDVLKTLGEYLTKL